MDIHGSSISYPPVRRPPYDLHVGSQVGLNMMKHWLSVCKFMEHVNPKTWMEIDHTAHSWLILGAFY